MVRSKIMFLTAFVLLLAAVVAMALNIGFNASAQQQAEEEHCVVQLEPLQDGENSSQSTVVGCFESQEEAHSAVSGASSSGATITTDLDVEKHCVVRLEPLAEGEITSQASDLGCFDSFEEAISIATAGRLQPDQKLSPEELTDEMLNGNNSTNEQQQADTDNQLMSSVVIGIDYAHEYFTSSSITWTAPNGCEVGYEFAISSLVPHGWNDRPSSARSYSNCDRFTHYEDIEYEGTSLTCDQSSMACDTMGYMDAKTSSLKLLP